MHPAPSATFERMVEPHRRGLLAHCYRMLGSWTDAEDVLQDALLKAWNGLSSLQAETAFRHWLYQVATNTCLSALRTRRARTVPQLVSEPSGAEVHVGAPGEPDGWVEPFPDAAGPADLAEALETRQSVALGFILALQRLSPRQRAVLLLCEVVGYQAAEVAPMLGASTTAVNSALARARAALDRERARTDDWGPVELGDEDRRTLERYRVAWEAGDVPGLVELLTREASFSMPPIATWFRGKTGASAALAGHVFASGQRYRAVPVTASGVPALILLKSRGKRQAFRPLGVQLLWVRRGRVRRVTTFLGPRLAETFLKNQRRIPARSRV